MARDMFEEQLPPTEFDLIMARSAILHERAAKRRKRVYVDGHFIRRLYEGPAGPTTITGEGAGVVSVADDLKRPARSLGKAFGDAEREAYLCGLDDMDGCL